MCWLVLSQAAAQCFALCVQTMKNCNCRLIKTFQQAAHLQNTEHSEIDWGNEQTVDELHNISNNHYFVVF